MIVKYVLEYDTEEKTVEISTTPSITYYTQKTKYPNVEDVDELGNILQTYIEDEYSLPF